MKEFMHNLDGKYIVAILAIIILGIFGTLGFTIHTNTQQLINISSVSIGILVITILIAISKTKNSIRYYSLAILVITPILLTQQKTFVQKLFDSLLSTYFPNYTDKQNVVEASPFLTQISIMIFVLLGIYIVNYFMRDNTAMGISKKPIDDIVPESSIKEQIQRVIGALNDDLRSIDLKTNWSIHNFVPLDAEVEVSTGNRKQKRITNLLDAIQKSDDRLFLVLGDPGSGKSVSLRKLARELAEESEKTGKIPIYVNLKEWSCKEKDKKPTVEDIKRFVLENILNRDIVITKFFKKYFDRLYEEGRLYFIFDSFDEIPMLLNESEDSELIQHYSEIFFKFLKGARAESSQGVLASRIFRKPTRDFQVNTILEIRPFDDEKIMSMFKNLGTFSEELQMKLFKERHDLVPVARNPFTAQLISDYAEKNGDRLPKNQAEMYKSYIISTLESCEDKIKRANLTVERIFELSIEIAQLMFEEHGFEIHKSKLVEHFDRDEIDSVINILKFARLGRFGNDEGNFSFVHRRFAEYFIVEKMIEDEDNMDVDYKSIPEDSKWRDALVLYCEVTSFEKAKEIANFCWETIDSINNPKDLRVIHTVRFLRDAFKGRKECLVDFEDELAKYIYNQIDNDNETIEIKLAVESVGLLKSEYMDKIIVKALNLNNYWISDTALKSCRHLQEVSSDLIIGLKRYIWFLPLKILLKTKRDILFSFSLSSTFKNNVIYLRNYNTTIFFITILLISATFFSIQYLFYSANILNVLICIFYVMIISLFLFRHEFEESRNKKKLDINTSKDIQNTEEKVINKFLFTQLFAILSAIIFVLSDYNHPSNNKLLMPDSLKIISIILFFIVFNFIILDINRYTSETIKQSFFKNINLILEIIYDLFLLIFYIILALPTFIITFTFLENFVFIKNIQNFIKDYGLNILIVLLSIIIIITFLEIIFNYFKDLTILKKAYKDNLSSRKKIQYFYEKLEYSFIKIKFLDYIDANYTRIKGKWSDDNILKVSSNNADIYLAKLEAKWRGIEK